MGMLIKNIKEILKNDQIVCWNCKSDNIVHNHNYMNSGHTENGVKYRNHELHCKDCDKEFMYSAIENSEEDRMFDKIIIELLK